MAGILGQVPTQADVEAAYNTWQKNVPWYSTFLPKPAVPDVATKQAEEEYLKILQAFQSGKPITGPAAPAVAPKAPAVAPQAPNVAPVLGRFADEADAVALPPLAQAMNVPTPPAADMPYEGPDAPFDLNAPPIAQAMGQQPGILQQIMGNPYASNLLTQMGAGMLRGKDLKEGLANAFDASSKANAVKRTPLTGAAAGLIMEEYPDGRRDIVSAVDDVNRLNKPGKDYIWDKTKKDWILDPNSKTARDIKKTDQAKLQSLRGGLSDAQNAIDTIDQMSKQIDESKVMGIDTATGLTGAVMGMIPGNKAYAVRETAKTIQAAFGIGKLQEMKQSTPTGASGFGQLAIAELDLLIKHITSLNPNQDIKDLIPNIEKAKMHFQKYKEYYEKELAAQEKEMGVSSNNQNTSAPTGNSVADRASGYLR